MLVLKDEKEMYNSEKRIKQLELSDPFDEDDKILITDKRIYIQKSNQNFITLNNKNINRVDHYVEQKIEKKDRTVLGIILLTAGTIAAVFGIISVSYAFLTGLSALLITLSIIVIPIGAQYIYDSQKKSIYKKSSLTIYYDKGNIEINFNNQNLEELIKIRNVIFSNIRNNL